MVIVQWVFGFILTYVLQLVIIDEPVQVYLLCLSNAFPHTLLSLKNGYCVLSYWYLYFVLWFQTLYHLFYRFTLASGILIHCYICLIRECARQWRWDTRSYGVVASSCSYLVGCNFDPVLMYILHVLKKTRFVVITSMF